MTRSPEAMSSVSTAGFLLLALLVYSWALLRVFCRPVELERDELREDLADAEKRIEELERQLVLRAAPAYEVRGPVRRPFDVTDFDLGDRRVPRP